MGMLGYWTHFEIDGVEFEWEFLLGIEMGSINGLRRDSYSMSVNALDLIWNQDSKPRHLRVYPTK